MRTGKAHLIHFALMLGIISCTTTVIKDKIPVFNKDANSIQEDLKKIVRCRNVDVMGTETNTNGKITTQLEVNIIDPIDLPSGLEEKNELNKQIAKQFKNSLQNPSDFDRYKVSLVHKESGITYHDATEFLSEQLNN